MNAMKNLIVIPAFNEEEALPQTLAHLGNLPEGYEVLVVNDGSKDATGEVARQAARGHRLPVHVVGLPVNSGIGAAVQTGYRFGARQGGYRYIIQLDADGQHDAGYVEALVEECERRVLDLCIGSRFLTPDEHNFRSTFVRRLGIRFFSWLISLLSGGRILDTTSGFRCAGPRAWRRFAECYPDDYPEPESLAWCLRNGLRVGELPVRMHERQGGVSSIRSLKPVYYMLKVSLAIVIDRLRVQECS
jgi:glycosyltransferase involved in cell wall biosynthesis